MNRLKINSIIFAVIFIYGVSSVYSFFLVKEWFPFHTTLQIEGPEFFSEFDLKSNLIHFLQSERGTVSL